MRIGIGIDTGGTSTDAVLIDLDTRAILDTSKALTTHYGLMAGILNALDGLNPELCRKAELAGLSTTLATNACVESKARKSRLLLLGIDHQGIARNGARFGLNDPDDIRYLPCRTIIRGEVLEEPDWSVLRQHAREWFSDVEAVAVCEIFAVRNEGVVEKKAAQIIEEETGLPVVVSSTLFGDLSSLERAASALLNAGLIPITRDFLNAAKQAFRARGISAELMVVRSDSSLMSCPFAMNHAVETLLSGPAASALGGSTLVGADQAIIVDIGGTTTDIALIDNRLPILCEDGIRVGDWKTLVHGLFSTSFALGGDSVIRWRFDALTIGPERVIPLCRLGGTVPRYRANAARPDSCNAHPLAAHARVPDPWPHRLGDHPHDTGRRTAVPCTHVRPAQHPTGGKSAASGQVLAGHVSTGTVRCHCARWTDSHGRDARARRPHRLRH